MNDAANQAWNEHTQRMAGVVLGAEAVGGVGRRMREFGTRPIGMARPAAEQQGLLGQVGLTRKEIDTVQQRAWEVMRTIPSIASSDRLLGAAYDIKSGISSLDAGGVADFTELAALAARSADSSPETMAKVFSQGYEVFRQGLPDLTGRQFAGALGAQITAGEGSPACAGIDLSSLAQSNSDDRRRDGDSADLISARSRFVLASASDRAPPDWLTYRSKSFNPEIDRCCCPSFLILSSLSAI